MVKENNTTITINDIEYDTDNFTDTQKILLSHVTDLDRKVNNIKFNLDQLTFGRDCFLKELIASLENKEEVEEAA